MKLGATAGLRLLPEGKAPKILEAVQKYLETSPFQVDSKDGVTILDGEAHRANLCYTGGIHACSTRSTARAQISSAEEGRKVRTTLLKRSVDSQRATGRK